MGWRNMNSERDVNDVGRLCDWLEYWKLDGSRD